MNENIKTKKGLGVTTLVLGIIAVVLSIIPIINLISALLLIIAIIFGIVSIILKNGRGLAIGGICLSIIAAIIIGGMYYTAYAFTESYNEEQKQQQLKVDQEVQQTLNIKYDDAEVVSDSSIRIPITFSNKKDAKIKTGNVTFTVYDKDGLMIDKSIIVNLDDMNQNEEFVTDVPLDISIDKYQELGSPKPIVTQINASYK